MANQTGFGTTIVATLSQMVSDGVRNLVELFERIRNGFQQIAPLVLGLAACHSASSEPAFEGPPPPVEVAVPPVPAVEQQEPQPIGKFMITFYYMIGEEEVAAKVAARAKKEEAEARLQAAAAANDEPAVDTELVAVVVPELVNVYDSTCTPITEVTKEYARALALQGTGKLRDGRVLNVWGHCGCERSPCFKVTGSQWGTSGSGRALLPFRTVAVDPKVIKLGTLLYVPLLEGRTMPGRAPWGGYVHDGCVVADDTGGGIDGHQLDLFVGRKGHYLGLSGSAGSHSWARHVPVYDGTKICERKGRKVARKTGAI